MEEAYVKEQPDHDSEVAVVSNLKFNNSLTK